MHFYSFHAIILYFGPQLLLLHENIAQCYTKIAFIQTVNLISKKISMQMSKLKMKKLMIFFIFFEVLGIVSSEECPQNGMFYQGTQFALIKGLPRGWNYWHSCAKLCQDEPKCNFWSTVHQTLYSDHNRQQCYLFESVSGTRYPDHENIQYFSGPRNCSFIEPDIPDTVYVPGTPGGSWTPEEISITRQKILQMLSPVEEVINANYDDWNDEKSIAKLSENSFIRLGFHDCLRYEDGSGGCDGCLSWKNMGSRPNSPHADRTDNNDLSKTLFWLEQLYTRTDWPFTYSGPNFSETLKNTGKSRADLWAFASWVALERSVERANHACDHDYLNRQQIPLLEGRDKCDIKLHQVHKFRYGRKDCFPTDPDLPYKAAQHELHPMMHGTGTEAVQFMKEEFGMPAHEFVALMAVHSGAAHSDVGIKTQYNWFAPNYLSNMYHKMLASRPTYQINSSIRGLGDDGRNMGVFGRGNATSQYFAAVAMANGEPYPMGATRWRVFCSYSEWTTPDKGPCLWRPMQHMNQQSCFDGIDKNGKLRMKTTGICQGSFIDEKLAEHNRTQNWEVWPDEELEKQWIGEFAMLFEYGLYKKFESSKPSYRPVGCPGLPDKWEDMPYGGAKHLNWTKVERCPLNDYAPEGKPLYQIVEDTADDHDVFGQNLLAGFERMIQNGYDSILDLQDAPTNSWFGYYTMENQDRFSDVLEEKFEEFVVDNAPLTFTDPNADPYICALAAIGYWKCRFTFSQVAEMAKWQYTYPLQFIP